MKRHPATGPRLPPVLAGLALALVSSVLSILVGEWIVRVAAPQNVYRFPRGLFVSDKTAGYRLASNFRGVASTGEWRTPVRTNALGLREDQDYEESSGTERILLIGDSFTMGVGVTAEETFGKVLQRELNADGGADRTYEVINAGVPGYTPWQAVDRFTADGPRLKPDLVVLGFFVGNDLVQSTARPLQAVDGFLQEDGLFNGILPSTVRAFLSRRSHLYNLLWPLQRRLREPDYAKLEQRALERRVGIYRRAPDSQSRSMWRATRDALTRLQDGVSQSGAGLLIVVMPESIQVYDDRWERVFENVNEADHVRTLPDDRMLELAEELHVQGVDLLPALRAARHGPPLYYQVDEHWTKEGNRVVAVTLRDVVKSSMQRASRSQVHAGVR